MSLDLEIELPRVECPAHTLPAISLHSVRKSYRNGAVILLDFSLDISVGTTCAILGPSGSGKSSLLRVISGLDAPEGGSVTVFGQAPRQALRDGEVALLSSESALLPWRTTIENVRLPLDLLGHPRALGTERARTLVWRMRLEDVEALRPHELSDGQRQRLRLAQALVTEPRVILLDEPFSAADEALRHVLIKEVGDYLSANQERTSVFVTHYPLEAAALADRVLRVQAVPMNRQPLRIISELIIPVSWKERDSAYVYAKAREISEMLLS